MKTQIFITGSTGFIGEQLADKLVEEGCYLSLLVRNPEKSKFLNHPQVKIVQGDLMNLKAICEGMENCTQVYHLAGYAKTWTKNPREYYDVHVNGTQNILDAAEKMKVNKVVVTSTCAVLGPSSSHPVNEESRATYLFNDYEKSKFQMEQLVERYANQGLNVTIVSPSRVYGPGREGECNMVVEIIKKYLAGKWRFITAKRAIGSYVYIDDVIKGLILAMDKGERGERYILGGDNREFRDLFTIVRRLTGVKFSFYSIPMGIILVISFFESNLAKMLQRKPLLPYDWSGKLTCDWAVSSEKAIRYLGYSITSFEEGLKKTLQWLKQNERKHSKAFSSEQ